MNDPHVFRRRRLDRLVANLSGNVRTEADIEAVALEARDLIMADPALKETAVRDVVTASLEQMIVEEARRCGAVEVEPGVWQIPPRTDGAA